MKTVTINDEAAPLLKQGLDLEKRILKFSYNRYRQELEGFEKQHAMSTEEFIAGFNSETWEMTPNGLIGCSPIKL